MSLKDRLVEDMKVAMKAKEEGKVRLSVVRMARAAIKNVEIDKKQELNDEQTIEILARELKKLRDSVEEFKKANRPETVAGLEEEISILMEYLPQQLSEGEICQLIQETLETVGAQGPKDLGKVMKAITPQTKGRADGKQVNQIVRELLGKISG
ncbi:MAG: GatB/YqeY domain-containing protein [Desulfitobacteriaceae bacterium]|nr:GatB/YqeY domain-containing protein [Desulfitobacteriaceae bacterium]MDD4346005.1 GatB/YqeY domain-containing protein [Desulfitobacteriaceae bacterium]MDD4400366.1 GatB/YqeY domain-containing protein [Desulfitobacteriaceae bacterium]